MKLKMSQISGMNLHYSHHTFDFFLNSMNHLGLTNIELWAGSPHLSPFDSVTDARKIGQKVRDHGLKIVSVDPEQCSYPINIASGDEGLRKFSMDYLARYINSMNDLGASRLLLTSGWGYNDEPVEEAWKRSLDGLHTLAETASTNGIIILFEILLPCESNLVNDFESTIRMLDELKVHTNVEACLDTVPVCAENKTLGDYFSVLGRRVTHIHLCDGTPIGHVTWGDGTQDLSQHIKDLESNNYTNCMTLEMEEITYRPDPEYHLIRGMKVLSNYLENDIGFNF